MALGWRVKKKSSKDDDGGRRTWSFKNTRESSMGVDSK